MYCIVCASNYYKCMNRSVYREHSTKRHARDMCNVYNLLPTPLLRPINPSSTHAVFTTRANIAIVLWRTSFFVCCAPADLMDIYCGIYINITPDQV